MSLILLEPQTNIDDLFSLEMTVEEALRVADFFKVRLNDIPTTIHQISSEISRIREYFEERGLNYDTKVIASPEYSRCLSSIHFYFDIVFKKGSSKCR